MIEAVEADRVGLWGFSQGAWVAPLAASMSERVAFLVLVAATGVTPAEQMMYATAEQLRRAGYGEDVVARSLDLRRRFEEHARRGGEDAVLRADLLAALDEPWIGHLYLPPVLLDDEGRALWIEEMDLDPRPVLGRLRVPTLCFFGAADAWTPVEASVRAWREECPAAEIVVLPGAEHDLTLPDGTLVPEYEQRLVDWLVRV